MEGTREAKKGKERFWTRRYFPGLPGLGTRESGEVWKGPSMCSTSRWVKGLRYLPLVNSLLTISWNIWLCSMIEGLLGGEKVLDSGGILVRTLKRRPSYMLGYQDVKLAMDSHLSQASGL